MKRFVTSIMATCFIFCLCLSVSFASETKFLVKVGDRWLVKYSSDGKYVGEVVIIESTQKGDYLRIQGKDDRNVLPYWQRTNDFKEIVVEKLKAEKK